MSRTKDISLTFSGKFLQVLETELKRRHDVEMMPPETLPALVRALLVERLTQIALDEQFGA